MSARTRLIGSVQALVGDAEQRVAEAVGGPARRKAIILLAAVLSLQSADSGTIGALAAQLERAFRVGNTELGLLVSVSSLVGAAAAVPFGILVDRTKRVRLLMISIVGWSLAMMVSGFSVDYVMLLLTRLGLGVVIAVAGPSVASLVGDFFAPGERARVYGFILTGDLLGAGAGLLVAGDLGAALGWRAAFFVLGAASLVLGWVVWRHLPEPARGGQGRLRPGATDLEQEATSGSEPGRPAAPAEATPDDDAEIRREVRNRPDIDPDERIVVRGSVTDVPILTAARYVLRIPSNRMLIVASALGYFFFAGLRTFAVLFSEAHFGVSQATVSGLLIVIGAGAIAGVIVGGRAADRWIARGRLDARMLIGGIGLAAAAVVFVPGLISTTVAVSLPIFVIAAVFLSGVNPALDAARLDVLPSRLWGRGESIRGAVRTVLEAFAPLLFGYLSSLLGGTAGSGFGAGVGKSHQHLSPAASQGLEYTFLIMLVPLALGALLLVRTRRRYLVDVASADLTEQSADLTEQWLGAAGDADSDGEHSGPSARTGGPPDRA